MLGIIFVSLSQISTLCIQTGPTIYLFYLPVFILALMGLQFICSQCVTLSLLLVVQVIILFAVHSIGGALRSSA